jgi:O-antigen ligase
VKVPVIANVLAFAAFMIAPMGVVAQKGEVIVLGLAGAVLFVQGASAGTWRAAFRTPTAAIFLALLLWAMATAAWAVSTPAALELWKSLALIFAAILMALNAAGRLTAEDRKRVATWAAAGLGLGLILLGVELAFDQPLMRLVQSGAAAPRPSSLNAGVSIALAVVGPIAAALWRRGQKALGVSLIVAVAGVVGFSDGTSAKIALIVAAAAFFVVWIAHRKAIDILCLIAALMILAAPIALNTVVPPPQSLDQTVTGAARSALHRLYIWDFAARRIIEKPFVGWGLDASRDLPGGQRRVLGNAPVMSLHPHNAALQVWLELGAPGAALAALLVLAAGAAIRRRPRAGRAASAAALFGALTIAGLSFGLWQNWWMATLGLIAVLSAALNPPADEDA